MRARWNRFWFSSAPAEDLAVARILFFAGFLAFSLTKAFHEWGDIPAFFHEYRARYLVWFAVPIPGTAVLVVLEWVWRLSILMAAVGLFSRTACLVAGLGSLFLMGLDAPEVAGRSYTAGVFVPLILGFSRCGDALSVDAWLRRHRGPPVGRQSDEYGWPSKLVRVFLCYTFLAAGIAKIRYGGFPGWMLSGTLSNAILQAGYWYSSRARPPQRAGTLAAPDSSAHGSGSRLPGTIRGAPVPDGSVLPAGPANRRPRHVRTSHRLLAVYRPVLLPHTAVPRILDSMGNLAGLDEALATLLILPGTVDRAPSWSAVKRQTEVGDGIPTTSSTLAASARKPPTPAPVGGGLDPDSPGWATLRH